MSPAAHTQYFVFWSIAGLLAAGWSLFLAKRYGCRCR